MKVYIATSLERRADHNAVRDALAHMGHALSYDWTAHGPVWADGAARIREVAALEMRGVIDADLVIVLLPGGRGTHAELGAALAAGRPVLLHSVDPGPLGAVPETCAFYHHPSVRRIHGPLVHVPILADCVLQRIAETSTEARP